VAGLTVFGNHCAKLRLATIHDADVVMLGKSIMQWLLGRLRNIRTNRRLLRNELVRVVGPHSAE